MSTVVSQKLNDQVSQGIRREESGMAGEGKFLA